MGDPAVPATPNRPTDPIDRLARHARLVMTFERLWPALVLAFAIAALFVAVSWLGLWLAVPRALRIVGVLCFAAGLAWSTRVALRRLPVSQSEALRRLDRDSGLAHRPISNGVDRLANASADPVTSALWDLSRRRLEAIARAVRVAPPAPRLVEHDPYALRIVALLGLVAAAFVAGPEKDALLGTAFEWGAAGPAAPGSRVDAWVDPPGYTGRPPVVLFASNGTLAQPTEVVVPVHSTVVVRASGAGALDVTTDGGLKPAQTAPDKPTTLPSGAAKPDAAERRLVLDGSGRLTVTHDRTSFGPVAIRALPDLPPSIALVGKPAPTARGGLTLAYKIGDDYGVASADASFSEPAPPPTARFVRSLVPPPKLALNLPPTPGGLGNGQTTAELSDHPWAGSEVTVVLAARDEGGNVGLSAPVRLTLPARPFANPLARALVEQRQNLVFDPDNHDDVGVALDALMIDPDAFGTSKAIYLGLYTARQRLSAARTDDDLVALADYLWQIALKVEEGDLGQTARDLRAAEQALREALQRNAPSDEIKRLTEELKRQMDKFVAEMQQHNQRPDDKGRPDPNAKSITQQDLKKMMDRMQQMAEAGDTAEAQRMLDQLQSILDNLKTAQRGQRGDQASRDMNKAMSDLEKMTQDQQALRDKTFRQGQKSPRGQNGAPQDEQEGAGQPGDKGQPDDQAGDQDLQGQQQGLRQRLEEAEKTMRQLGLQGEQGLDEADDAMKDAETALSQGPAGNRRAVDAQGRALQGLQKGASGMAQQMARGQSDEDGEGQGQGGQVGQGSSGDSGDDPLGRKRESHGQMESRGNALDEGVAARAQRVLQELRRRLANPNRPTGELDYLERLLQPN